MREILFRGKKLGTGEWVYGYFVNCASMYDDPEKDRVAEIIEVGADRQYLGEYSTNDVHEVDPETVGQWTGLVDKNGVKIFEGDVVRYKQVSRFPSWIRDLDEYIKGDIGEYAFIHEWTGVVTYKNGEFTPRPYICACEDFYYSFGYCDFEVIDNFWDNPELGG